VTYEQTKLLEVVEVVPRTKTSTMPFHVLWVGDAFGDDAGNRDDCQTVTFIGVNELGCGDRLGDACESRDAGGKRTSCINVPITCNEVQRDVYACNFEPQFVRGDAMTKFM